MFWAQKIFLCPIRDQCASIVLRSSSSYTKELTCNLDCSRYARVKLSPVLDVWLVQESFLREEFSVKISPQILLHQFHSILLCNWGEKLNNKFTNFRGRKNYSCTCLISMPSRRKQPPRRFLMNKPRCTLVSTYLPSISPQFNFFNWCICRFVLFC